jgi:hypothetical protein
MKWRSGFSLIGLTCWLGMVPACALFHRSDSASTQVNPPRPDTQSTAQSTPDRPKSDSPYQTIRPGTDTKIASQDGQRPIFGIADKPKVFEKDPLPYNPSTTLPGSTNVAVTPIRSTVRPENKPDSLLPAAQENRVVPRDLQLPPLPAQLNKSGSPDVSATVPVPAVKQSDSQVVVITPQPARDATTHEAHSAPSESPLLAFMRLYLEKRPAEAIAQLNAYDKTRQDLLLGLLSLAASVTEGDPTKIEPQQIGVILNQLKGIASPLIPKAPFTLTWACPCVVVREFGDYDKLPPDYAFKPGAHMEIYVEMQNFSTVRRNGGFEVWPSGQADIYDDANRLVPNFHVAFDRPEQPDVIPTWTPLRDAHRRYTLTLPKDLPPGKYTLRLQVEDRPSHRTAKYDMSFTVIAANRQT